MMHNPDVPLTPGTIIRYGGGLWRVEYVNVSRARICPLGKRATFDDDGGNRPGVSIAPNSYVEEIDDVERAQAEMELAKLEAEVTKLKAEIDAPPPPPPPPPKAKKDKAAATPKATAGHGWRVTAKAGTFREGSLAEMVMALIVGHPGLTTKDLVNAVQGEGNVASCVSRFFQAGLIERMG